MQLDPVVLTIPEPTEPLAVCKLEGAIVLVVVGAYGTPARVDGPVHLQGVNADGAPWCAELCVRDSRVRRVDWIVPTPQLQPLERE